MLYIIAIYTEHECYIIIMSLLHQCYVYDNSITCRPRVGCVHIILFIFISSEGVCSSLSIFIIDKQNTVMLYIIQVISYYCMLEVLCIMIITITSKELRHKILYNIIHKLQIKLMIRLVMN